MLLYLGIFLKFKHLKIGVDIHVFSTELDLNSVSDV